MMGSVGHFAGLIDFGETALALTTDGVGTKMLVADQLEDWSTVGIDCIAMNVNDLYVMNMEPVAFVDYIATDKLSIDKMAQIGIGLNEGAKQANIDIVGGETASLRGPRERPRPCRHLSRDAEEGQDHYRGKDQAGRYHHRRRLNRCPQQRPLARPVALSRNTRATTRSSRGRRRSGRNS